MATIPKDMLISGKITSFLVNEKKYENNECKIPLLSIKAITIVLEKESPTLFENN